MPVGDPAVRLSPLDTDRFGVITARADEMTNGRLDDVLDYCQSHRVELLIARSRVENVPTVHALSAAGFVLMDTLIYYERDLLKFPIKEPPPELIESLEVTDIEQVEQIARECFRDYSGHYHADPRLDRVACQELYASWARACCIEAESEAFVLVAGDHGDRVGFGCFRRLPSGEGELLLGAVRSAARGRGLYTKLTVAGMHRLQALGAKRFVTSTHVGNWGAEAAWTRAGLRPYRAYYTFHRWFDRR